MNNNQLLPYWSNHVNDLSKALWIPHKALLSNIDLIKNDNSWFSFQSWNNTNYSNKLKLSSLPQLDNNPIIKVKKIRIYPNAQQKNLFRQWLGTSRKVYNDTVNHLNLPKEIREKSWMFAAKIILNSLPDWAKSVPYQVKKIAVEDAYKAFSNGCKKAKITGKSFQLKYRTRKDTKQSCFIPSSAFKPDGELFNIYPTIVGKLKVSECLPSEFKDSRLI